MQNLFKKLIKSLIFGAVFLIPVILIYYTNSVLPMSGHEFRIPFGREFLNPEHGRYIATAFGNTVFEQLPRILNIHVLDFRASGILFSVIILSISIFSIIGYGFLLFFEKTDNHKHWLWLLCYIVTFLIFFNHNFRYLYHADLVIFFEYTSSLIPYLTSLSIVFWIFSKQKIPSNLIFGLFLCSSFFTGISIEALNIPYFLFLCAITLFVAIDYRKDINNETKKQILKIFIFALIVNTISCAFYYLKPVDHDMNDKDFLLSAWKSFFPVIFDKFINKYIIFHLISLIGLGAIAFRRKNFQNQNVRFFAVIVFNTVSLLTFCFLGNYYIFCMYDIGCLLGEEKYFLTYVATLFFQNFVIWGYYFATSSDKKSVKILYAEIGVILLILAANYQYFQGYLTEMTRWRNEASHWRKRQYCVEKLMVAQAGKETITFPNIYWDYDSLGDKAFLFCLMIVHYPDFKNLKTIVVDNSLPFDDFMEKEADDYKFSNLLQHKIEQYEGDYSLVFEEIKEENDKVIFELQHY